LLQAELAFLQAGDVAFHWKAADVLTGIGGLLTYPTTLFAGIAAVRAGRLSRWRRWALLGLGVYQISVILVPLLLGAPGPAGPSRPVGSLVGHRRDRGGPARTFNIVFRAVISLVRP
jgi:hypothetical protein